VRISEVFHSIQGEGQFADMPSVFVRTTGCNLRCWFCDTPYTSWNPEGRHIDWMTVAERVREFGCEHVVLTGGEPLLQPDVVPLTRQLGQWGLFVTIETAGTVYRPVHADLVSLSPKLANSTPDDPVWTARHERLRTNRSVMQRLMDEYPYQLKFVIDRPEDVTEVPTFLNGFPDVSPDRVWLMPQGIEGEGLDAKAQWLRPEADRLGYRFSPRRHIELFGNVRGK
jgi:7-carboxy-7-deazaguanine synthase